MTMTRDAFMDELGKIFDKTPKPEQLTVYREKLRRFSPEQLVEILNRILEECRAFPKVSDVFKAAQELGYLSVDLTRSPSHHWEITDCGMCHGEGRLAIFWEFFFEDRDTGRVEVQQISHVAQYTKSFDRAMPANEFRSVFRCKCTAGDAPALPKVWPKLSKATPSRREVWL